MDGNGAVRHGGHHLPEGFGSDIAYGIDAGEIGLRGFTGDDIAGVIQIQVGPLPGSVAGFRPMLTNTPSQLRLVSSPFWTLRSLTPVTLPSCSNSVTALFQ